MSASITLSSQPHSSRQIEFARFMDIFLKRRVVLLGTIVIFTAVLTALFASWLAPYDPYEQNLRASLQKPSSEFLLGTDALGRDLLSRIIYGSQASLMVGIFSAFGGALIGTALGLLAGYFGGLTDSLIMRFIDALLAIPPLMLALAIGAALGGGLVNVTISLAIALVPTYARVMRGQVLTIEHTDFVTAGRALGASDGRIMLKHILPNCLSPLIVLITLNLGVAILAEAGLSFLGVGIRPPGAAWGSMVSDGYRFLSSSPLLSLAPGLCVLLVVLGFNLVGDGLRDALDPRMRGSL